MLDYIWKVKYLKYSWPALILPCAVFGT